MLTSRRRFVAASLSLAGAAAARAYAQQNPNEPPPGAPPAFGTGPAVGPEVSQNTFSEAEKLVQFQLNNDERVEAAHSWRQNMAFLYERRVGPRKVALEARLAPATKWNPLLPGIKKRPKQNRFIGTNSDPGPLPSRDADIAFAPVTRLSRWIEQRKLTSERLTNIYIDRLARFDPHLRCVITLMREQALAGAKRADEEIAAGKYRGPLHGIPWGAKDLLDTAGVRTTYGAEPFRDRIPAEDAVVVKRLNAAGAVLVAKMRLGGLRFDRCLVRWTDDESLAARGRVVGFERGAGRGDSCRSGRFCHRKRNRWKHRRAKHAVRGYGIAPDVRTGCANGGDDSVLVAR